MLNSSRGRQSAIVALSVAILAIAAGLAITYQPIAVLAIAALGLVSLAITRPYLVTMALICSAFTVDWLVALSGLPKYTALLTDAIALSLVIAAAARLLRRDSTWTPPASTYWLIGAIAASVVGLAFSRSNLLVAALQLRTMLRFMPLIFVPSIFCWPDKLNRRLIWAIIGFATIQAPVALWQFLTRASDSGDTVGGTLGNSASGTLTTFVIAILILVAALYIYRAARSLPLLGAMLLQVLPPALNETKVFFVAAPLLWASMIAPRLRRNVGGVLVLAAILVAGFAIVAQIYSQTYSTKITTVTGRQALLESETVGDLTKNGNLKRIPAVKFSAGLLGASPQTLLFGYGTGSSGRSDLTGSGGLLYSRFGKLLRNMTFLVMLVLESGLIGLVAFVGFLVSVFLAGMKLERRDDDAFWKAVGMGLQGTVLTLASLSVYTATFNTTGLACAIWTVTGVTLWRLAMRPAVGAIPLSPAAPAPATLLSGAQ
jgi:hypothetical protein